MKRWPSPAYAVAIDFRVPIAFAYAWCTDYRPYDGRLLGTPYERWVLRRDARSVVFEDLGKAVDHWWWRRTTVALQPPDRWTADSIGNVREARLEYRLTPLSEERTRFALTMHRRPTGVHPRQPPKKELESELRQMWSRYGKAMERDYRRSRPPRSSTGRTRRAP
ncbi:MAG: hypothetical protein ACREDK_08480 [Thermoplasmata archaeon]